MKCVKINPDSSVITKFEDAVVDTHSIIGILKDKDDKYASVYNILTLKDKSDVIGIKTSFSFDDEDDDEYVRRSVLNIANMDDNLKEQSSLLLHHIPDDSIWYSDCCIQKRDEENKTVTISGWRRSNDEIFTVDIILPIGVYIMLSKVKSDMISHIDINPYYTFTDEDFKYEIKKFDKIDYLGSEPAGIDENGANKIVSMYHIYGDDADAYITVPFGTYEKIFIKTPLSFKEFSEKHETFINFNPMSFMYMEYIDDNGEKILEPCILIYNTEDKSFELNILSTDICTKFLTLDSEVKAE